MKPIELALYRAYAARLEAELVATLSADYGHNPSIYDHLHTLWIAAVEEVLNLEERSAGDA